MYVISQISQKWLYMHIPHANAINQLHTFLDKHNWQHFLLILLHMYPQTTYRKKCPINNQANFTQCSKTLHSGTAFQKLTLTHKCIYTMSLDTVKWLMVSHTSYHIWRRFVLYLLLLFVKKNHLTVLIHTKSRK